MYKYYKNNEQRIFEFTKTQKTAVSGFFSRNGQKFLIKRIEL